MNQDYNNNGNAGGAEIGSELQQALEQITRLIPHFSYKWINGELNFRLSFSISCRLAPSMEDYLALQGILYRFPELRPCIPIFLQVTEQDLRLIADKGTPCPYRLNARNGQNGTCPARKGETCQFAQVNCPWIPPKVDPKEAEHYCRPHDKVSITVFSKAKELLEQCEAYGSAIIVTGKEPASIEVVLRAKEMENLPFQKELTPYDRLIHDILGSLAAAGNTYITPGMIYKALRSDNNYAQEQITQIKKSVQKMQLTWISIDNHKEIGAGFDYPKWKESGILLPWRTLEVDYYGQKCDGYEVTEELPLFRFARKRRQISYLPVKALLTANNITPLETSLEQYLLDKINLPNLNCLDLKTLFETFGITRNKKRFLARKPTKLLDHYKATGLITSFEVSDKQITWTKPQEPKPPKATRRKPKTKDK